MRHVILPQAVQRILPPLGGQFISTIKDSAIVSVISIQELTFRGMELMSATYLTFETWITITGLYFVLTFGCSLAFTQLENACRRSELDGEIQSQRNRFLYLTVTTGTAPAVSRTGPSIP